MIALPPSLGGVVLDDGRPSPVYPEVGTGVDRPPARAIVEATLLALEPKQTSIPTTTVVPVLTDEDVDRAVAEAEAMLVEPIQLDHEDVEVVFTVDQLTEAFRSETVTESEPRIVNSFDPEAIDGYLNSIRNEVEAEPVNATYEISGDSISIVPGSSGPDRRRRDRGASGRCRQDRGPQRRPSACRGRGARGHDRVPRRPRHQPPRGAVHHLSRLL